MKIYLSVPIAILIFIFTTNYAIGILETDAQTFTQQLQQLEQAVHQEKQENALQIYKQFVEKWQQEYKKWAILVDHDKLDEINRLSAKIKIDLRYDPSSPNLEQDIAEITYLFQIIPQTEKITWQNVL